MLLLPITQAAKKTGVTSRTLRHYDAIGLLPPADTAADGRRYYGEKELLRLQHILILKELGVDLATTARVLDAAPDHAVGLLKDHLKALTKERDRFARLAATVSRTIDHLEEGKVDIAQPVADNVPVALRVLLQHPLEIAEIFRQPLIEKA